MSRRSSVSWDSRAELFFWDWAIWVISQRSRTARIMATTSKPEFMDYYFTRAERNSPLGGERKRFYTRARRLEHRDHREDGLLLSSCRAGEQLAAPLLEMATRLVSTRIGTGGRRSAWGGGQRRGR